MLIVVHEAVAVKASRSWPIRHGTLTKPITTTELESSLLQIAGSRRDDVQQLFSFTVYADTAGNVKELFRDVIAIHGLVR